ncbi:hypothetical protein ACVBEH_19850 [Roseateles sp. GG27B]
MRVTLRLAQALMLSNADSVPADAASIASTPPKRSPERHIATLAKAALNIDNWGIPGVVRVLAGEWASRW